MGTGRWFISSKGKCLPGLFSGVKPHSRVVMKNFEAIKAIHPNAVAHENRWFKGNPFAVRPLKIDVETEKKSKSS